MEAALVPAPRILEAPYEDGRRTPLVALPPQTVLDELRALEAQLACFRDSRGQLEASYGTGNTEQAFDGVRGLRRAIQGLAATYIRLRRHVLAFDAAVMGDKIGSFGELAIRAQTLFVAAQLNELAHAIDAERQAPAAAGRGATLFTGRLRCLDDVASLFCEAFARINATWTPYRVGGVSNPAADESTVAHAERYREAICDAQRALLELGDEPTIASFLRAGAARADWPAVHSACGRITLALQISLSGEPDFAPPMWTDERPATHPSCAVASDT